ncbi:hypothetical protein LTR08_006515 [Meristemomyces frigidus]|nr:hypothetical protein LTR08_006515 [Meristemomyces frigidus]
MKGKRSKTYRKLMQKYEFNFGFRNPYQVLVDAAIIQDAARFKMRLGSLLEGTLHGELKPMITQCCIRHLYTAPATTDEERRAKEGWIEVAKGAERRRCGHHELEQPLSALECLLSVVDPKGSGANKNRYVVATQDLAVRKRMREIAGVPLVYIHRSVMILEPMAARTEKVREADEAGKIRAGLVGRRAAGASAVAGGKRKREEGGAGGGEDMPARARAIVAAEAGGGARAEPVAKRLRKVKGLKGPNPLSVRKAKKEDGLKREADGERVEREERAAVRVAARKEGPQGAEVAVEAAGDGAAEDGLAEGSRKRKRKRKPREGGASGGGSVVGGASVEAGEDA